MEELTDLILENEGLIYGIINKYKDFFELEDLYQVAVIGMIKAYKKYNKDKNAKFTTYAYPYILGEVIKYINSFQKIKVNKDTRLLYAKIMQAKETLSQRLMKEPTTYEISLFLEIDESIIIETINSNVIVDSLDKQMIEDNQNFELYDKVGVIDQQVENYPLIYELEKLPEEDRKLIEARYYNDMSQKETGTMLGMYQVEVSRQEKRILQRLKDNIAA